MKSIFDSRMYGGVCGEMVDGRFNFTITITEIFCPQTVQYNMMNKQWKKD